MIVVGNELTHKRGEKGGLAEATASRNLRLRGSSRGEFRKPLNYTTHSVGQGHCFLTGNFCVLQRMVPSFLVVHCALAAALGPCESRHTGMRKEKGKSNVMTTDRDKKKSSVRFFVR